MAKMKLENLLPVVMQRLEVLKKHSNVLEYKEKLRKSGNYNKFEVRFAWDVCGAMFTTEEICGWYDKYGCHDAHITSLFIAACRKTELL